MKIICQQKENKIPFETTCEDIIEACNFLKQCKTISVERIKVNENDVIKLPISRV